MKKALIVSIIINIICLPLAAIYVIRKIQFLNTEQPQVPVFKQNVFYGIRETEFKELPIDSNSIVFIGDSHTQNFELAEFFKDTNIKNRGIIMDGSESVLSRIDNIIKYHPKKIFIQIGINDLLSGNPVDTVVSFTKAIITKIQSLSPHTVIYYQSLIPTNWNTYHGNKKVLPAIKAVNKSMQQICLQMHVTYINLFDPLFKGDGLNPDYNSGDSLHLNGKGYLIWRDLIRPYMPAPDQY